MADGKYPFLEYIEEPDKEKIYKKASDCGWYDPHNNFLIGDSGGFLLNIRPGSLLILNYLMNLLEHIKPQVNILNLKLIVFLIDNLDVENVIEDVMDLALLVGKIQMEVLKIFG